MNDEKVFRLLMETNPVPDPDGLDSPLALTELERRDPIMTTRPPSSGKWSNGLLIGAVAAVAVLIVGLGSWAAIAAGPDTSTTAVAAASSTTSPSTTGAPTPTTPPTEAESLALATVTEYYDALNRGDVAGVMDMLIGPFAADFGDGTFPAILAAANSHVEVIEPCRVVDVTVDHQGFPIDPASAETAVECRVASYNDYHGPAGVGPVGSWIERVFVTDDGKLIALHDDVSDSIYRIPDDVFFAYNRAFYDWLEVAHPDIHEEIKAPDGESIPGWFAEDPGHMAIAIQYIDEFVAQSDVYPLDPDNG